MPLWLKSDLPDAYAVSKVARTISSHKLNTICLEARCPNKKECFESSSVTFLILGRNCTRKCRFCNVVSGPPACLDKDEPERITAACVELGLDHVILTSVTRDDLADGGSSHFARCINLLKRSRGCPVVEVLTPDFGGNLRSVAEVVSAGVDVFGHNIETVERLYGAVRDGADYRRSLGILGYVRSRYPDVIVKSGLMLGLGETLKEVTSAIRDLAGVGCEIITIGQYMRPSKKHQPVKQYFDPAFFDQLACYACESGLVAVCGPRVRSSYLARAALYKARLRRQRCA